MECSLRRGELGTEEEGKGKDLKSGKFMHERMERIEWEIKNCREKRMYGKTNEEKEK